LSNLFWIEEMYIFLGVEIILLNITSELDFSTTPGIAVTTQQIRFYADTL